MVKGASTCYFTLQKGFWGPINFKSPFGVLILALGGVKGERWGLRSFQNIFS